MNFTDIFIRKPVLSLVVTFVILVAGFQSIGSLNVRQYPRSENAIVTVTTAYIGANAKLVRGFITTPLERAIAAADGIDYIDSTSSQGLSTIQARLRLNYDANKALAEISSKVLWRRILLSMFLYAASVSGKWTPISPRESAPSMASQMACSSTSASLWPLAPL